MYYKLLQSLSARVTLIKDTFIIIKIRINFNRFMNMNNFNLIQFFDVVWLYNLRSKLYKKGF